MYAFDPKVIIRSRKPHQCYGCLEMIPTGRMYIAHPVRLDTGSITSRKMCVVCSFLLSQSKGVMKRGNFTEKLIPNCLRKVRAEFLKNPKKAIERIYNRCRE